MASLQVLDELLDKSDKSKLLTVNDLNLLPKEQGIWHTKGNDHAKLIANTPNPGASFSVAQILTVAGDDGSIYLKQIYNDYNNNTYVRSLNGANETWGSWVVERHNNFISVEEIGLTDTDFSPTDFLGNMSLIFGKLPFWSTLSLTVYGPRTPNFASSLAKRLKEDIPNFARTNETIDGNLVIKKFHTTNVSNPVSYYENTYDIEYRSYYDQDSSTPKMRPFEEILSSNRVSNPNILINGDFQVWQDGTTIEVKKGTSYSADMWRVFHDSAANVKVDRPGQYALSSGHSGYAIRMSSSQAIPSLRLMTSVELDTIESKFFTLSFEVYCSEGREIIHGMFQGNVDTSNSFANEKVLVPAKTWTKVSLTGKTKTKSNLMGVCVGVDNLSANALLYVANVKLEYGKTSTQFVSKSKTQEYLDCCRYYYVGQIPQNVLACDSVQVATDIKTPTIMRDLKPKFTALTNIYCHFADAKTDTFLLREAGWSKVCGGNGAGCDYQLWILNGGSDVAPSGLVSGSLIVLNAHASQGNRLSDGCKFSLDARIY